MRIMNPTISVIMGAYNCARTLPEAIAAIQHQTVSDWEFIICDDGSSDETWQVACEFQRNDERIVLLKNEKNFGLNATLNKCLAAASGYYIARMDGDDICAPDRFEKELALYAEHPEAGVISCSMSFFDDEGIFGKMIYDAAPQPKDLLHGSQFWVVSRVMRKFDLALAEIYFRGRVHAPWLPSSGQGAKGQGRRYAARLALDAL